MVVLTGLRFKPGGTPNHCMLLPPGVLAKGLFSMLASLLNMKLYLVLSQYSVILKKDSGELFPAEARVIHL